MTNSNFIENLANYVATGALSEALAPAERFAGALPLRQICICILSWLKARARFPKMYAMKTSEVGSSEEMLLKLLEKDKFFSSLFMVHDGSVKLHDEITQEGVKEIISTAELLYQPSRFITCREK